MARNKDNWSAIEKRIGRQIIEIPTIEFEDYFPRSLPGDGSRKKPAELKEANRRENIKTWKNERGIK